MKRLVPIICFLLASSLSAQIDTSPGGGPNGYNQMYGECANLDPVVRILEKSFVEDFSKKNPNAATGNFFELLEKIIIHQSVKSVSNPQSFGQLKLSCNQDEVEELKSIREMYKAATIGDEKCAKHLKDFQRIENLDRVIKLNEKN